jgi:predicted  nucleic acid-binding Zn-ribbon protein
MEMPARKQNNRLEEAMRNLMQSQAALVAQQTDFLSQQAAFSRQMAGLEARTAERFARIDERFARVEKEMKEGFDEIRTILIRHEHMLQALPEAIRDKIGFRTP